MGISRVKKLLMADGAEESIAGQVATRIDAYSKAVAQFTRRDKQMDQVRFWFKDGSSLVFAIDYKPMLVLNTDQDLNT